MLRKLPKPLVDEVALKAIHCTVHKAIRRGWFRRFETRDLIHDTVVQLLRRMNSFDPTRSSWSTFCAMVARNFLNTEARRRQRPFAPESLGDPESPNSSCSIEDGIEDQHSTGQCFAQKRNRYESIELHEDVMAVIEDLADPLREFCEAYLEDPCFETVAHVLGISRQTVYRRRDVVRERVFERLQDYRFDD